MNKVRRKISPIIRITSINIIELIWVLIIIRCIFKSNGMILESFMWVISFGYFITMAICNPWNTSIEKRLLAGFGLLCLVQAFGLLVLGNQFAIKNTIATPLIGSLVIVVSVYGELPGKSIIRIFYYMYMITVLLGLQRGVLLDNTFSGCFVFVNLLYLSIELSYSSPRKKRDRFYLLAEFIISILITTIVTFKSGTRTALLCFLLTLIGFAVFRIKKMNPKFVDKMFYVAVAGLVIMTFFYIHISEISWFQTVNELSRKYFDKNINSSRGLLWQSAFQETTFFEIIFGRGTGTLPQLERYKNSSFHNTYIQLIVQNGVIGLLLLLFIFRTLWKKLCKYTNDIVIQFILCCFLGILLYNCFECTLLQNKAFLGAVQWVLISFGIIRIRLLENKQKANGYVSL